MQGSDANHYLLLERILQTHRKSHFQDYQSFEVRLHSTSYVCAAENEEENEILEEAAQKCGFLVAEGEICLSNLILHRKRNENDSHRQSLTLQFYGHCSDTTHLLQSYNLPQFAQPTTVFHPSISHQILKSSDGQSELTLKMFSSFITLSDSQINSALLNQTSIFKLQSRETTEFLSTVGSSCISLKKTSKFKRSRHYSPQKQRVKFERTYSQLSKTRKDIQTEESLNLQECARFLKLQSVHEQPLPAKRLRWKRSLLRAHSIHIETEVIDVQYPKLSEKASSFVTMLVLILQLLLLLHLLHPFRKV